VVTNREEPPARPPRRFLPPKNEKNQTSGEPAGEKLGNVEKKERRRQRRMLRQQERVQERTGTAYSDAYCAWCGFGPDEELPGYVDCPDHLKLLTRGHLREVRRRDDPPSFRR
jgi:hypothetical protein